MQLGWLFLLAPSVFWLAVALRVAAVGTGFAPVLLRAFGWGMLAFPLSLLTQTLVLQGRDLTTLGLPLGSLAVLVLVGPTEEFWKAALVAWRCRPAPEFTGPRAALACGLAAAAGYAFFEHLFRFLNPATPVWLMTGKAVLGVTMHTLVSALWAGRMAGPAGRLPGWGWLAGVALAGVVHGVYNVTSFLPAWLGSPLWLTWVLQASVDAALLAAFVRRLAGTCAGPASGARVDGPAEGGPRN
jgi:RsiW-degrading membrane proteinase PrsW (M82 family)